MLQDMSLYLAVSAILACYAVEARVLYSGGHSSLQPKTESGLPFRKFPDNINNNSSLPHYNDVTKWEIEEDSSRRLPIPGISPPPGPVRQHMQIGDRTRLLQEDDDIDDQLSPFGDVMIGGGPASVSPGPRNGLEQVVSMLSDMSQELQALRGQVGNLKFQNHLIYKQLKRVNNRCTNSPALPVKAKPQCPKEFQWNESIRKCYKFATDRISWRMARERCRALGSDLVSIESSREQRFLTDTARKSKDLRHCDFWAGATDDKQEGYWRWAANNQPLSYSNWNHNEPNNGNGDEHCMHMLWVFNWAWNDARCNYDNSCYICETKPNHVY